MSSVDDLIEASRRGEADRVRDIIGREPALASAHGPSGETPVIAALYSGHRDIADLLLQAGARTDLFANAALGLADRLPGALDAAQVNVYSYDGWTPLHLAAFFGQQAIATRLVAAGADVRAVSRNSMANTPLHAACAARQSAIALELIAAGGDVNAPDAARHTPLHIAAENGMADVVKALLDRGADPLAVDAEDQTPLSRAAKKNHNAVIDLLNAAT